MAPSLKDLLCCPACRGTLSMDNPDKWSCRSCKKGYPVFLDIPDFRLAHHEYCSEKEEKDKIERLMEKYEESSFEALAAYSKSMDGDPPELESQFLKNKLAQADWSEKKWFEREHALSLIGRQWHDEGVALELGCGWGGTLWNLARRYDRLVGLDINLGELVMARKFIQEKMDKEVLLVCASADSMPFKENSFSFVNADDVIEHVKDPNRTIHEVHRTMDRGGLFFFNSPNRYSLFHKEGHVQIYGVGFLPRR